MTKSSLLKAATAGTAILSNRPLPIAGPFPTNDPFLFCVYHKDQYPAGNKNMEAPRIGNGSDFDPSAKYRMYHGSKIPGFPQHPHRGFETITATIEGLIDHADSVGNGGRYGNGDLQWMTAGAGVVHSEMFPLLNQEQENPFRFFQIWLNLPAKNKMVPPSFAMFWDQNVHKYSSTDKKAFVTVWAGAYFGMTHETQNKPPPDSWASDPSNDVAVCHVTIHPGGTITIPKANNDSSDMNRSLFYIEGPGSLMTVDGTPIDAKVNLHLDASKDVELSLDETSSENGEFLWLQGKPIQEPVAKYGPFVMNTQDEIQQAFFDYRSTEFGGWPWPRDDMVFARDKGRFALTNGIESFPDGTSIDHNKKKDGGSSEF